MNRRQEKEAREREAFARELLRSMRKWFEENPDKDHNERLIDSERCDFGIFDNIELDVDYGHNDSDLTMIYFSRKNAKTAHPKPPISINYYTWRPRW